MAKTRKKEYNRKKADEGFKRIKDPLAKKKREKPKVTDWE